MFVYAYCFWPAQLARLVVRTITADLVGQWGFAEFIYDTLIQHTRTTAEQLSLFRIADVSAVKNTLRIKTTVQVHSHG